MPGSFTLGRIGGIDIGIHYTWLFAFALVTWSLAEGFFPVTYPGFSAGTYWLIAALAALLLFASVLVHELSHSLVAIWRGQGVHSITLFVFGGVSNLRAEAQDARDEFLVAVVGPLTSLILAGLFWTIDQVVQPGATPAGAILGYLSVVNLGLGLFNLVPGFPLDGGRVLRSAIWAASGSLRRATRIASIVGQTVGFLLIAWGVWRFLGGDFLGGLWTAFIGWFLNNAAEASRQQQALRENLRGIRVRQLMNPDPPFGEPDMSVRAFVHEQVLRRGHRAVLVMQDGRLLGLMSLSDVKHVPTEAWGQTSVAESMTRAPLKTVSPDAVLSDALKLLVESSLNQLPVVDNGRVVGLLSRADVLRFLQLRDELDFELERTQGSGPRRFDPGSGSGHRAA